MDYARAPLADRLAAEYVLGTLRGPARRRFEALLPAHPSLRTAVLQWQAALMPLTAPIAPVAPNPRVWTSLERQLFGAPPMPAAWWQRLGLWRGWAGLATAASLVLAVALSLPPPVQSPVVVVLAPSDAAAAAAMQQAKFVVSVSGDGRSLVLKPLDTLTVTPQQALELWAVPAQGAPRSLGLVASDRSTRVMRAHLLEGTAAFAVSVEPPGGSPTGAPSGPIVSVGHIES